ncbi:MAG TPA: protease inhibitor I42 family protein [Parvularculaceae bacterium]|nr:protease inhibitor I42 family protein [Parvularculaceae bacterium]HNS86881.1 protease inhibitor I42 family protein [Parvularculaceae bacterium]
MIKYLAAASVLLAACANQAPDGSTKEYSTLAAPTPAGVALVIKSDSDGQNVTVKTGTTIAVELVGVPTAGYMWAAAETPAFLEAAGEYGGPTSSAQLEPGFAGGNHWEAFLFNVTGPGEGVLRFEQRRPWESDEPPTDEFSVYLFAEE